MKDKRGFELSFSMIFSIIVIIAIIGVAFYAINTFLNLQKCTQIQLFYDDFQDDVDRAWSSEYITDSFEGVVPNSLDYVCVGDASSDLAENSEQFEDIKRFSNEDSNVFLVPSRKACDSPHAKINHLKAEWKCLEVKNGKVSIPLRKQLGEALVSLG